MTEQFKAVWSWITHTFSTLAKGKGLSPAHLALILLFIGPAISYLALPIEGEYWAGLMPSGYRQRAYCLAFAMDFVGGFLMYVFGRVRQSARKGSPQAGWSFAILPFVAFGVATSAFVNQRQLAQIMGQAAWWESVIIAMIQPGLQLGINVAQAVVEGKFEKQPASTSEPKAESAQAEPVIKLALPFHCEHCPAEFATQQGLNAHQRGHKRVRSNGHSKEPVVAGLEVN